MLEQEVIGYSQARTTLTRSWPRDLSVDTCHVSLVRGVTSNIRHMQGRSLQTICLLELSDIFKMKEEFCIFQYFGWKCC